MYTRTLRTSVVLALVVGGSTIAVPRTAASGSAVPTAMLFKPGYNLCRAARLAAIGRAGGQRYAAGVFVNATCLWERRDLKAGIALSTHPPRPGAVLMRDFLALNGKNGFRAKRMRISGASKAVIVTLPGSGPGQVSKDLFAAYSQGVLQLNMTVVGSLPDSRLVAVLKVIARA